MRIINRSRQGGSVNANVTTAQIFPLAADATQACVLFLPGTSRADQKKFIVRAAGYVQTHVDTNVTISLYKGTSLVVGSDVLIKASSARQQDGSGGIVIAPFYLEAELVLDSASGKLHGGAKFCVNNNLDALAAITAVTGLDPTAEPVINLVAGVTFSAAHVDNLAQLGEFALGF